MANARTGSASRKPSVEYWKPRSSNYLKGTMNFFIGPFRRLDGGRVRREIDEELQLHIDLLTEEHCRQNIPWEQAQTEAMKRFGNVEQIRDECVKIARRNQSVVLALKWFFACVFLFGILVRFFSTDYHVTRIGDLLIEVGALARLLLYLRGKSPAKHAKGDDESALLKLNVAPLSLAAHDQLGRTPVERVVSSK